MKHLFGRQMSRRVGEVSPSAIWQRSSRRDDARILGECNYYTHFEALVLTPLFPLFPLVEVFLNKTPLLSSNGKI